jgi:hypothetical protein
MKVGFYLFLAAAAGLSVSAVPAPEVTSSIISTAASTKTYPEGPPYPGVIGPGPVSCACLLCQGLWLTERTEPARAF